MIASGPRLILLWISAEEWMRRYGLMSFERPCSECQRPCKTSLPFVQGAAVGLASPPCPCGNLSTPYAIMRNPKYGDLFNFREPPKRPKKRGRAKAKVIRLFPPNEPSGNPG